MENEQEIQIINHETEASAQEQLAKFLDEAYQSKRWMAAVWFMEGGRIRLRKTSFDFPRGAKHSGPFREALLELKRVLENEIDHDGGLLPDEPLPPAPILGTLDDRLADALKQEPPTT